MTNEPKRPKRTYPVDSFGPELLSALREGGRRTIRIPLPHWRQGVHMQMRLQQLRQALRRESHPLMSVTNRARTKLLFGEKAGLEPIDTITNSRGVVRPANPMSPCVLIVEPSDSEFADALASAGIVADDIADDVLIPSPPVDAAPSDDSETHEDFLSRITREAAEANSKKQGGV